MSVNELECEIIAIQEEENFCFIKLDFEGMKLGVMNLGGGFRVGQKVLAIFKDSDVLLALSPHVSARNKFLSRIVAISHNSIMARVTLEFRGIFVFSLVSFEAVRELGLQEGSECYWLIKSNEIILRENNV